MKTIKISSEMEKKIVAFCDDELNYHINESGCADEYEDEIEAEIYLLNQLGYVDMANDYKAQYEAIKKDDQDEGESTTPGSDDDVIESFLEDHLEDFVGFDPYEDEDGYDYREAMGIVEEYLENLSVKEKHDIATGLLNDVAAYRCCDQKIIKIA